MIRTILLNFLLLICSAGFLQAQTLKNIHRNNLPTLHIPTNLIDKVETVVENGARQLKITQTSGYVSLVPAASIDSITHSEGQAVDPEQLGNLRTASVFGVVRNDQGEAVPMALVKSTYSPQQTTTDSNGVFFLNDFVVFEKLGFITVEKAGYFKGSRSFLPLENGANRLEIQLLPKTLSGTFSSNSGGNINAGSLQMNFPSNAIVQANGQPYSGSVNVFARALDPTAQEMFDQMPGDLLGGMNDSLRILRSFGMAAVELLGSNNEPLQLAGGQNATLRFTIPAGILSEAPETIDWWSFDEEAGYWKHEGIAQKQGNEYIGQASHFSWWNVDFPSRFVELTGLVNNSQGNPVGGALIEVITQTLGNGYVYTNTQGNFGGRIPMNQNITVNVLLTCLSNNDWTLVYTEELQSETEPLSSDINESFENRYPITGTIVNCAGEPVSSGYVITGAQIFISTNGQFSIETCFPGTYSLRGFDASDPNDLKASELVSVEIQNQGINVGTIETCLEIEGTVTDIDGNVYPTVVIGSQNWMAANLKTTRFANGDLIPNVIENAAWAQLSTPAWCNHGNNASYDAIYGKLYNWYTVDDSRNICPDGWHVPNLDEWNELREFLGGQPVAGGKMKITGHTQDGSGSLWTNPNTGATNESGFSALPAGYRWGPDGTFSNLTFFAGWWTSTAFDTENAYYRFTTHTSSSLSGNHTFGKRRGFSVRCVKD
jgi:uncharacterized protein (TIGR02145 family)